MGFLRSEKSYILLTSTCQSQIDYVSTLRNYEERCAGSAGGIPAPLPGISLRGYGAAGSLPSGRDFRAWLSVFFILA